MIALISELFETWSKLPVGDAKRIALVSNTKDNSKGSSFPRMSLEFFEERGFYVEDIDLRVYSGDVLFEKLKEFDIICVIGGNTFYLLEMFRKSGFDKILPRLLKLGIHYVGQSAGACVMGSSIEPMKYGDKPELSSITDYTGLGYVDFVFVPHVDSEKYIPIVERIENDFSDKYKIRKFTDSQGVIIEAGKVKFLK